MMKDWQNGKLCHLSNVNAYPIAIHCGQAIALIDDVWWF